jgi:hypothetical protein
MTKLFTQHKVEELPVVFVIWIISSWWVLFPVLSLSVFMIQLDQVVSALGFVAFRDVSVVTRWFSAVIDRRVWLESILLSFRFEDIIFYILLGYFCLIPYRHSWVKRVSITVICMHVFMQASLVLSLSYALQASNVNRVFQVIQVGGAIIGVLAIIQILLIFISGLILLWRMNAQALQEA